MGTSKPRKYAPSFLIGLLLVPLSGVAAFALVSGQTPQAASALAPTATSTTVGELQAVEVGVEVPTTTGPEVDLSAACGEDGLTLVEAEAAETISDLEKAALDALRPICAEAGMDLPGPPAPAPVIRTVTVSSGSGSGAPATGSDDSQQGGDEYDERDEDDERDDHAEDEDEDDEHDRKGDD